MIDDRGVEQLVARQAHNLEVACSSPASATNNDIASCKATSYVVFSFYTATNLRQRFCGSNNIVDQMYSEM